MADPVVIDASAWLAVLLREENADLVEAHLIHRHLLAPELIRYETANGILLAERRGRLTPKGLIQEELFKAILSFPIQTVPLAVWWDRSVKLVQAHGLTFYDAAYVGVAKALQLPLLTLDKKILNALKWEKLESVL